MADVDGLSLINAVKQVLIKNSLCLWIAERTVNDRVIDDFLIEFHVSLPERIRIQSF